MSRDRDPGHGGVPALNHHELPGRAVSHIFQELPRLLQEDRVLSHSTSVLTLNINN